MVLATKFVGLARRMAHANASTDMRLKIAVRKKSETIHVYPPWVVQTVERKHP